MKFLKKFNTEEEYEAYLNSEDFVRPCVARIVEDKAVRYKKRYKHIVYVQHIDGKLYTKEQWTQNGYANELANGVAVITNEAQFVIAKKDIGRPYWSNVVSSEQTLIEGVFTTTDKKTAMTDFAGISNTQKLITIDECRAAISCNNYAFPNGSNGYLPAAGEWNIAYQNKEAVDEIITLIGGDSIQGDHWSSTQYGATKAWCMRWVNGMIYDQSKAEPNLYTRAFCALNID